MGSSGNLALISLKENSFERIKECMLNELLKGSPNYSDPEHICEEYYFKVAEINNIYDFISLFSTKIVSYCPRENGIIINGKFYDNWASERMPQIIDNYLVLYDTDQQMQYQSLPIECLRELISHSVEIWT